MELFQVNEKHLKNCNYAKSSNRSQMYVISRKTMIVVRCIYTTNGIMINCNIISVQNISKLFDCSITLYTRQSVLLSSYPIFGIWHEPQLCETK